MQLAEDGTLGERRDWGGKLCGVVARLALGLHGAEWWGIAGKPLETSATIPAETVRAALAWTPYLIEQSEIVTAQLGADPSETAARRILRWMERKGLTRFSKRDAFDQNRGPTLRRAIDLDPPLALLEECGYVRCIGGDRFGLVGRPASPEYEVNPLWRPGRAYGPRP